MPELPEVETVRQGLLKNLLNQEILETKIYYPNIISTPSPKEFSQKIKNQKIIDIQRRGKYLIFCLSDYLLISHLRMEGKYFIKDKNSKVEKHEHIAFILKDQELRYHDTRKFGKMYLIKKGKTISELDKLGKEPFDKELNEEYLKNKMNRNISVKTLLLDQTIIAGIGNIYADEILFLSKINPLKKGLELNQKNYTDIINNTKTILKKAINAGGTTIHSYQSLNGITGKFQQQLSVHNKKGEKCSLCRTKIEKTTVGGRGTYYCPKCQGSII